MSDRYVYTDKSPTILELIYITKENKTNKQGNRATMQPGNQNSFSGSILVAIALDLICSSTNPNI